MQPSEPYRQAYWIISETILILVSILALYVLCSLSSYAWNFSRRKNSRYLVYLPIASLILALARFISDQVVAFYGWQTDDFCLYSVSVSTALYSASMVPVYVFLWIRQNTFYSDSKLKHLVNKKVVYLSRATLAVLVGGALVVAVLYEIPSVTGWTFQATSTGCRDAHDQQDFEQLPFFLLAITTLGQFSLLGLLLYPLITTKKRQRRSSVKHRCANPALKHDDSMLRRAMLGSYQHHSRQSSAADSVQKIEAITMSGLTARQTQDDCVLGIYDVGKSDDDVFESAVEADSINGDFTSHSEQESEDDVTKPTFSNGPNLCKKSAFYFKKEGHGTPRYQKNNKNQQQTPSRHRTASTGSAQRMIAAKAKRSAPKKKRSPRRSTSERRRERELNRLILKVFLLALICVVTDILTTILQLVLVVSELAYLALYDLNLTTNITCIILSLKEWKQMISPPWKQFDIKRRSDSTSSQTSAQASNARQGTMENRIVKRRNLSDPTSFPSISSACTGSFSFSRSTSPTFHGQTTNEIK